jgi:hypothetical protein
VAQLVAKSPVSNRLLKVSFRAYLSVHWRSIKVHLTLKSLLEKKYMFGKKKKMKALLNVQKMVKNALLKKV